MIETIVAATRLPFARRRIAVLAALFVALCCGSAVRAGDMNPLLRDVANAYGMGDFHTVEKIVFTFNVKQGETFVSRTWVWRPQSTELMYVGPNESGALVRSAFYRNELNDASPAFHHQVEKWFVNDSFWLLFPMMAAWDSSVTVTDGGSSPMPLGGGSARKLTVKYPMGAGQTGDSYVLYIDNANRIRQWAYHPSSIAAPKLITTWDENTRMGPLLISMSRQDQSGSFKLWFSNVVVTSRQDRGGDIPTVSEFTAMRYRAHSELAMDYRRELQAEQLAAERASQATAQPTEALAAKEAEARRQAQVATNREAALNTPKPTGETDAQAAERRRQAQLARAEAQRAKDEADRLAEQRENADRLAREEADRRRREAAQLAAQQQQQRTEVRQTETTAKPSPASADRSSTIVAGMDTEIDPDITVRKDGGIMVQGVIHTTEDLAAYLKAVAKRDRGAPVTVRLDRRYDAASYVVVMNILRQERLKNLVVVNSR